MEGWMGAGLAAWQVEKERVVGVVAVTEVETKVAAAKAAAARVEARVAAPREVAVQVAAEPVGVVMVEEVMAVEYRVEEVGCLAFLLALLVGCSVVAAWVVGMEAEATAEVETVEVVRVVVVMRVEAVRVAA